MAGISETLTVGASDLPLQTDRSDVRTEMNSKQFQDLPAPGGRNYQAVFKLVSGFTPPRPQNSLVSNAQEDLVAEVNGTTKSTNNTKIGGAGKTHIWLNNPGTNVSNAVWNADGTINKLTATPRLQPLRTTNGRSVSVCGLGF
jgi:hypothetical protein